MRSLITLIMVAVLVLAQGTALAASVCHHAGYQDHVAARLSSDSKRSAAAFAEETAGSAASKKGSLGTGGSVSPPADLLPASTPEPRFVKVAISLPRPADGPSLQGMSLQPPLPPPLG